jgi:hypothetical protein
MHLPKSAYCAALAASLQGVIGLIQRFSRYVTASGSKAGPSLPSTRKYAKEVQDLKLEFAELCFSFDGLFCRMCVPCVHANTGSYAKRPCS